MALLQNSNYSSTSSRPNAYTRKTSTESSRRGNTAASAYVVDAASMALTEHWGGGFEDGLDRPPSPPRGGNASSRSGDDAAYHITEECERLFCGVLRAVLLAEKGTGLRDPLVMDMRTNTNTNATVAAKMGLGDGKPIPQQQKTIMEHDLPTPSPSPDGKIYPAAAGLVREYVEVFDYAGGLRFRGFVAEKDDERSLFVFFDEEVVGQDLKPGLMTLLELAGCDDLACDRLVVGVDRTAGQGEVDDITRDLGWVGFELITLEPWSGTKGTVSDRWIFLSMDV